MLAAVIGVKKTKVLVAKVYHKKTINLDKPQRLNEKLLATYYASDMSRMAELADKYRVRQYVQEKGLSEILIPIYGVYDSYDHIDFDALPERFVLKATHGCDMNYMCTAKRDINQKHLKAIIRTWLNRNIAYTSLELHYANIPHRILCEQFLETQGEIVDYKFYCQAGRVLAIQVCTERSKENYRDIFMPDWTHRPEVLTFRKCNPNGIEKPKTFEKMMEIAQELSAEFPFVRVDLYEVDETVFFGEMTFTPATGVLAHLTDEFLLELGKMWE